VFYSSFLSRVPSGVEIFVYPYLLEEETRNNWTAVGGTSTALEAVYKYVADWNMLLSTVRPDISISGVVTDYEEHNGFEEHLPLISKFRDLYSTPGKPLLRFGAAMGFDVPRRAASLSPNIDDVYLEMYDFYVKGSDPVVHVEQGSPGLLNDIPATLSILDKRVWFPFLKHYARPNMHFMWSLQARSQSDCLYPLGKGRRCGTKDDLGAWEPQKPPEFIHAVKTQYPQMSKQPHGFYEFSYMPNSWMKC
jgi:hypothetical protein